MLIPIVYILITKGMINQVIVSGACCCLQFCCKELAETVYKIIGRVSFIKIMYSLIYFSFLVFVYLSVYLLKEWEFFMQMISSGFTCLNVTQEFDCVSSSVIYRMTLSLCIFSALMVVVMFSCSLRVAHILNEGIFFSKFVVMVVLFFLTLQFDNSLLATFSNFCQVFSYVFILWQIVIVIDLAYLWGIKWAQKYSMGSNCFAFLLIGFTVINYILAVGVNFYGYTVSGSDDKGSCDNYPNILSTIMILGLFGIQMLNYNKQNSLLATSALTLFNAYWLLSAIFSGQSCNNSLVIAAGKESETTITKSLFLKINIPISCLFVLISSFGSIYGSSNSEEGPQQIQLQESIEMGKKLKPEEQESMVEEKGMWVKWHVFMMAMSIYLSMVLTDWGSGDILKGKFQLTANAQISKIFMAAATFAIYTWTLLAPRLFPSRNFYFQ